MEAASKNAAEAAHGSTQTSSIGTRKPSSACSVQGPRTVRGQQDRIYAALAVILIRKRYPEPTEERVWLFDEAARTAKWSLLAALGRVLVQDGTVLFWQATEAVKRERPKVKVAIRRIRDWQHRNRAARSSQD
jgi:hypothetical protein